MLTLGSSTEVDADGAYRGTDIGSLQPLRGYFSPLPWEHLDTKTGNLVLTFTDLVLPGNHGFDLVVQRTYNNDTIVAPSPHQQSWRWSIGLQGLVMRVLERPWPTTHTISTLDGEVANTPTFIMGDGSIKRTQYFYPYVKGTNSNATNSQRWVVAAGFSKSNRTERKLWMPDGRTCQYDAAGRLTSCTDASGNGLSISYSPSTMVVTQLLAGGQSRQIFFNLTLSGEIDAMSYQGRMWFYQRDGHNIVKARSPVGLEWEFGYSQGTIHTVTTPGGGTVTYGYTEQSYGFGTIRVLTSRSTNGPNGGTWQFVLQPGYSATERLSPVTEVETPSGATLRWENFAPGSAGDRVMGGGSGFVVHALLNESAEWVAREERTYASLSLVWHAAEGPAQLGNPHVFRERDPLTTHERSCGAGQSALSPVGGGEWRITGDL